MFIYTDGFYVKYCHKQTRIDIYKSVLFFSTSIGIKKIQLQTWRHHKPKRPKALIERLGVFKCHAISTRYLSIQITKSK